MIVNLTPHPIRLYPVDAPDIIDIGEQGPYRIDEIPPDGKPARIAMIDLGTVPLRGCDASVEYVEYGHVDGLPEPESDTWYIVSLPVALAATYRADLLVPYREVRNGDGTVVGCRQLARPV